MGKDLSTVTTIEEADECWGWHPLEKMDVQKVIDNAIKAERKRIWDIVKPLEELSFCQACTLRNERVVAKVWEAIKAIPKEGK